MVESIVLSGVAIGCIYALIGITYNVMFSASRVFSFTAGTLGMLGGVLGSLFIARMGLPVAVGFLLALVGGAVLGIVTEIVAYWNKLKDFPGVYGEISFTPEEHNGYPDRQIVMVEANSLKDGAFNLAPGYSA